jgi:hypothetical protein
MQAAAGQGEEQQVILQGLVVTQPEIEVGNHRQVDEGEGHRGAEVDERQRHLQIEGHRREGQRTHQQHVESRGLPGGVDLAEDAARQGAIRPIT